MRNGKGMEPILSHRVVKPQPLALSRFRDAQKTMYSGLIGKLDTNVGWRSHLICIVSSLADVDTTPFAC
jgi:hypothetical protein